MIWLENSYLQYTAKETGVKKSRIEKHLDTVRNLEKLGILTIKDWIINSYLSNLKAFKEEDYQTYNKRTGDMTKPRTVYWLESDGGGHYEITKIAYDFYMYIAELKATEKDVTSCIKYEKELEEKERLAKQKAEQLARQRVEDEKVQRKTEFLTKKKEYIKQGYPVIKQHIPMIHEELDKYLQAMKEIQPRAPREEYQHELVERYSWFAGNPTLMKSECQRYCIDYATSNKPTDVLYRNILKNMLGVDSKDSGQTVSAKIRAFIEGREYKPTEKRDVQLITGYKRNRDIYEKIEGEPRKIYNETLILSKDSQNSAWGLTEKITGLLLIGGSSKQDILNKLKGIKESKSEEAIHTIIKKGIERFGIAPNVYGEEGKYPYTRKDYKLNIEVKDKAQQILSLNGVDVAVHTLSKGITVGVDIKTGVVLTTQPTAQAVIDELTQFIEKETYERLVDYKKTGKI